MSYQRFVLKHYTFDAASKTLTLIYGYDDALTFTETFRFDFDFVEYSEEALDRAVQQLFFVAGTSYYKAFMAPEISVEQGQIDQVLADFLKQTYQRGLGEFFYVNNLSPNTDIPFEPNVHESLNTLSIGGEGVLTGIGGGKDSLVSAELLRDMPKVATWSLNHRAQLSPLVERVGLPHFWVERTWDPQLETLKDAGAMNGHIPISAIFACVGTIVAILAGYRDSVVSNESSASEPTLEYQGVPINHQYSKSLAFEQSYQNLLSSTFGDTLRYYSLLRPITELRVAELFAPLFDKYVDVFSSCNRAYVLTSNHMSWCGECAKCAFVFMILTPFIARDKLEGLWGKNLLLDPSLEQTYEQLLGISGDKPLDCVGEIKESRSAMRLAFEQYPELREKYSFEIPDDYDFRAYSPHAIPADIWSMVEAKLSA
jgi:hypothetical protein